MTFAKHYQEQLQTLTQQHLRRRLTPRANPAGPTAKLEHAEILDFSSNNYLGLANHPEIIDAAKHALDQWGFGPGASRLISGTTTAHQTLESNLAQWFAKPAALICNSGYAANHALLTTLPGPNDLIALDKLVHASLIDGARASAATMRTWPHKNTDRLRQLLDRRDYDRAFIVTDSLFSMDGDFAPLPELVELKHRYNAALIIDEAHAFGCIGPDGRGLAAQTQLLNDIDIIVVTFSKALGGSGAAVIADNPIIDTLINRARNFIFTTALPAVNCAAAQAALDIIRNQPDTRQRLTTNAQHFRNRCLQLNLNIGQSQSHIVPIIIGPADKTAAAAKTLAQRGFWVPAVRPPTVAPNASRLRVSITADHTQQQLDSLAQAILTALKAP